MNTKSKNKIKELIDESKVVVIATDTGISEIGNGFEIRALLSSLMKNLLEDCEFTKKDLLQCVEVATMNNDDLKKEVLNKFNEIINRLENK